MVFSAETTTALNALAKQLNVSLDELLLMWAWDRQVAGSSFEQQLPYYQADSSRGNNLLNLYNRAHTTAPITPGRTKAIKLAKIGLVVAVVLVIVAVVAWKKFKKQGGA